MAKKETSAADYALKMLGIRDYGEAELRVKLEAKNYPADEIDRVMASLKSKKFINDSAYAAKILHKYSVIMPSGRELVKLKMEEKSIKPVEYTLALEKRDELETARRAFKMKFGKTAVSENPNKTRQKAANYLATKGFDYDIIENILNDEIKGGNDFEQ